MSEIHHKSKFREFIQLFRHLDILATPYEFNVCESSQSQNVVGILYILKSFLFSDYQVASYPYVYITIYLKNSNQSLLYQGTQSEQEIKYKLDQNSALFALEISKYKTGEMISFDDELNQYLNVAVQYVNQLRYEGVFGYQRQKTPLTGVRCSENQINKFNFNTGTFSEIQQQNLICYEGEYQILGQFYDKQFSYIDISVTACSNTTTFNQCKSIEEILKFINQGINIDIFLTGMRVKKYLNITNPVDKYPVNYFWRLAPTIGNSQDIYLEPITIELGQYELLTQLGQDAKNKQIFQSSVVQQVDSRYTQVDITSGASLSSFYLRLSTDSQYYFSIQQSTFPLILQAISQAAGLMMAILGAFKIVYKIYATHKTFETIMNRVFKFDLSKQSNYDPEDPNDPNPMKNLYNYKLKFFFWDFIWMRICKFFMRFDTTKKYANKCVSKDKQVQLAYMAQKKILKDLDLANIVQKLYEIDFLKLYLLKPDQLLLFNSFSHPVLNDSVIQSVNSLKNNKKQLERTSMMKRSEVKKGVVQAVESSIPIEDILSQYSQFFQAQMRAETSALLVEAYAKFKNSGHKEKLKHQFDQYLMRNRALYQFLKKSSEPGIVQTPIEKKKTIKKVRKSMYSDQGGVKQKLIEESPKQDNPLNLKNSSSSDEEPSPSGDAFGQQIEKQDEVKVIVEVSENQEDKEDNQSSKK